MGDYGLTKSQMWKLNRLIYLLKDPEKFGCSIDKGDPENQLLIAEIINDASGVVDDINNREKRGY